MDSKTGPRRDNRPLGDPGSAAFTLDKYPFYLLNRTVSRYNGVIERRLRGVGLDIPAWRVLMVLGEHAPRGIGEIADACVINLSTMMRIIGRMRKAGLVTSAPRKDDARVTEVSLTEEGTAKLTAARAVTRPIYDDLIAGFSAQEFDRLIGYLDRLFNGLERMSERE